MRTHRSPFYSEGRLLCIFLVHAVLKENVGIDVDIIDSRVGLIIEHGL
jgi:hypothetical protein